MSAHIYREFGCCINLISVDGLFCRYRELGFLYPEKLQRLNPFWDQIQENWSRLLDAGDSLHHIVTYEDTDTGGWASLSSWRSGNNGWCAQHLVSAGNPLASRSVMLAEQQAAISDRCHHAYQNWFRPTNRLPKRIFGTIVDSLGTQNASVSCFNYMEVVPGRTSSTPGRIHVEMCTPRTQKNLHQLAVETRGPVYAAAEETATDDFQFDTLDSQYRGVGLHRYRRVWLAVDRKSSRVVAALIAYRGPLGLNFSFLENRADLLASDQLSDDQLEDVVFALISAASGEYEDFAPGFIPMVVDDRVAHILRLRGDQIVRQYCQSIWLRDGYQDWYQHTDRFYTRIQQRLQRQPATA